MKEVVPGARKRNSEMRFAFIYPDLKGRVQRKEVGRVHSTMKGPDDYKSLQQLRFVTGDFVDVAILGSD
jgi:hypothetical protein